MSAWWRSGAAARGPSRVFVPQAPSSGDGIGRRCRHHRPAEDMPSSSMGQSTNDEVGADPADCADAIPSRRARRRIGGEHDARARGGVPCRQRPDRDPRIRELLGTLAPRARRRQSRDRNAQDHFFVASACRRAACGHLPQGRRPLHEAAIDSKTTRFSSQWPVARAHANLLPDNGMALPERRSRFRRDMLLASWWERESASASESRASFDSRRAVARALDKAGLSANFGLAIWPGTRSSSAWQTATTSAPPAALPGRPAPPGSASACAEVLRMTAHRDKLLVSSCGSCRRPERRSTCAFGPGGVRTPAGARLDPSVEPGRAQDSSTRPIR